MRKIFLNTLIFIFLSATISFAQGKKSLQRKMHYLELKGHLVEAAKLHSTLHDAGERDASINAAMSLYKIGKYKDALPFFQHADSIGSLDQSNEIFAYFECLKTEKRYLDADNLVNKHLSGNTNASEFLLNADKLKFYEKLMGYGKTRIIPLPINTKYSEFGPTLYDGWLYFESTRITKQNNNLHGLNNQAYFNFYAHPIGDSLNAVLTPKGVFGKPQVMIASGSRKTLSIPADINRTHHDGPIFLTPEGKHMFFTTNWDHKGKPEFKNPYLNLSYSSSALEKSQDKLVAKIHLNIYYSTRENNIWSEPISFPYNDDTWSNQHALFDEKTGTLYFSSNMPGGMGGFDIWTSVLKGTEWTKPVNMGPNVNSVKNEVFPSLSPEGYLIFSSNGWPGLGGLDLFVSESYDQNPINLLNGLNTEMDDFGVVFIEKGHGYFVSNRKESVGDDDLFEFFLELEDIIEYSKTTPYQIILVNAESGEAVSGSVEITHHGIRRTVQISKGGQLIRLHPSQSEVEAFVSGLLPVKITLKDQNENEPLKLSMPPQPVVVEKDKPVEVRMTENHKFIIYFDFDKFNIRKDAAEQLGKVALELFQQYGATEVSLMGHTDTRGSSDYNNQLSDERVKMAKKWLINRGVDASRIKTDYYGEQRVAVECNDSHKTERNSETCLTPKQHQQNRRVEIEVTNVLKN